MSFLLVFKIMEASAGLIRKNIAAEPCVYPSHQDAKYMSFYLALKIMEA